MSSTATAKKPRRKPNIIASAPVHRPASKQRPLKKRRQVLDLFSGFGGLTLGFERAGFNVIIAANHNAYKIDVHEANHPHTEHFIADLVDTDAPSYYSAADLPYADILVAGVACTSHSSANAKKAYAGGIRPHDIDDPEWERRVRKSERERATTTCVLQYAAKHHPWMMLIECTTELTSWGDALPGTNIGDGSAFRWWLGELENLGYRYKIDYPNSAFHGVPQSRDRLFIVFWDRSMRAPDTEHRPEAMCSFCDRLCEAKWSWKTGVPPTGRVQWGKQWEYRCPSCNMTVIPPRRPCIDALDLSDLGQVIGERDRPLAESTMRRVERCIERMKTYPLAMTHLDASGKQHRALVTPAALATLAGNTFEWPGSDCRIRSLAEPMWTQSGTNTMGLVTPPAVAGAVVTYRSGVLPTSFADPTPTQAGHEALALVTASVMPFRANTLPATLGEPMSTQTGECRPAVITGAFIKQNGKAHDTAPHPLSDPMGTITSRDTTGLVTVELIDDFLEQLHSLTPEKARLRMFKEIEVQRGCGFPDDFVVWGSAADQVDGFGNAVSPPLGEFYARRMAAVL